MKKNYLFLAAKILLGVPLIIFGLNKFLLFANFPPPLDEIAQTFMGAMFGTYLAKLVGVVEIVGGILLLIPRTSFVGLLLLLPIVANIVLYHLAHDNPGNGIWIFTMVVCIISIFSFKEKFSSLLINPIKQN